MTPHERRKDLAAITHYLVEFQCRATKKTHYFVADVQVDNARYTEVSIDTNTDAPTSGDILVTDTGLFDYKVYGQASSSNLDPTDAAVKGVMEVGTALFIGEDAHAFPSITIPDNITYYE